MNPVHLILIAISGIMLLMALILILVLRAVRSEKNSRSLALDELAQSLSARRQGTSVLGEMEGVPFSFAVFNQPKGPTFGDITVPTEAPEFLAVRRRDWVDRLGERLGLVRPVTFQDPAWDNRVMLVAQDPARAENWLRDPVRRRAAADLGAERSAVLFVRKGCVTCRFLYRKRKMGDNGPDVDRIRSRIAQIVALGKPGASPSWVPPTAGAVSPMLPHQKPMAAAVGAVLGLAGLSGAALAVSLAALYPPVAPLSAWKSAAWWSAPLAPAAWALLLFSAYRLLISRLDGHRAWVLAAFLGLPAAILACLAVFFLGNGLLDSSPTATQPAVVQRLEIIRGKSATYKVWLQRRDDLAPLGVRVSRAAFRTFHEGETLLLTTRAGFHQVEWVAGSPEKKP